MEKEKKKNDIEEKKLSMMRVSEGFKRMVREFRINDESYEKTITRLLITKFGTKGISIDLRTGKPADKKDMEMTQEKEAYRRKFIKDEFKLIYEGFELSEEELDEYFEKFDNNEIINFRDYAEILRGRRRGVPKDKVLNESYLRSLRNKK